MSKVLITTFTRADTDVRKAKLRNTLEEGKGRAALAHHWMVHFDGVGATQCDADELLVHEAQKGQHVHFNSSLEKAVAEGYDYLVRVDDDCEFLSHRWLKKLVDVSKKVGDKMILAPIVKGLKHPPEMSQVVEVENVKLNILKDAIGGVCRLHPVKLLKEHDYVSDVRLPFGSGDAVGIGRWCKDNLIPMAYVPYIRVRHSTAKQEKEDSGHFANHSLFQKVPYIPPL